MHSQSLLALALVALLALGNLLTVESLLRRSDNVAATLNVAGKLRMLSQRVGFEALVAAHHGRALPLTDYELAFGAAGQALAHGGTASICPWTR